MTKPRHRPNVAAGELPSLLPRQQLFVAEYLKDTPFNATQAAIRAGYSKRSAKQTASQLLKLPQIILAINLELEARKRRIRADGDRILQELEALALSDISEVFDFETNGNPTLRPAKSIPAHARKAIESVHVKRKGVARFKMHKKLEAIRLYMQHLGMLIDVQIPIDYSKLTEDQLHRILSGEHPLRVLTTATRAG